MPTTINSRQAIAIGLGFVAVLSVASAAIPPAWVVAPALAVVLLFVVPGQERRRPVVATTHSARLRAVILPSTADALLWMAFGAAIGLVYLLLVLQL